MRRLLGCLAGVLPILSSSAAPVPEWTSTSRMECGPAVVTVTTHCRETEEDLPYCDVQTLAVKDAASERRTVYRLPFKDGNQPFIAGASCHRRGTEGVIVLERINFGNCRMGCEWSDYYSLSGAYLGTPAQGMNEGESLVHHDLSPAARALVQRVVGDGSRPAAELEITRARPR
jgi:hypothetical protein